MVYHSEVQINKKLCLSMVLLLALMIYAHFDNNHIINKSIIYIDIIQIQLVCNQLPLQTCSGLTSKTQCDFQFQIETIGSIDDSKLNLTMNIGCCHIHLDDSHNGYKYS